MKNQQARQESQNPIPLKAIKGYKDQVTDLHALINTAWNFAHTALWSTSLFSKKEVNEAKEWIGFYFLNSKNVYKAYSVFCQRVLLARQYLANANNRYIPLPTIWLNPENETGFVGTKEWYDQVKVIRESLPNHKMELKAFAEAIWELSQEPTAKNFCYWKTYFIEAGATGLLNLFLNTIANQQYQMQ